MGSNFKFLFGLVVTLTACVVFTACGQADGYANSGTKNTYNFVYFGNAGSSTINSYYVKPDGTTSLVANMISTGVGTSSVNDLVGSPNGKYLYASNKSTNNISWYAVDSLSLPTAGAIAFSSSVAALGNGTSATKIHPNGTLCYIANSTAVSNNISVCSIDATGVMTVRNDLFFTARTNPTNLVFSPDGRFLFVVNRGTGDVSSFSVNSATGTLTTINLSTPTGSNPEDLVMHPNGRFLYTLSTGSNLIYMHSAAGGTLTPLTTPTIATGVNPKKIAISPNGKYVFVTNNGDNTISTYVVNSTTGLLTPVVGSPFAGPTAAGVYALTVLQNNIHLIVTGDSSAKGYVYSIDDGSGAIALQGAEFSLGANPRAIVTVPLTAIE